MNPMQDVRGSFCSGRHWEVLEETKGTAKAGSSTGQPHMAKMPKEHAII